jgi:hypothetical protein
LTGITSAKHHQMQTVSARCIASHLRARDSQQAGTFES